MRSSWSLKQTVPPAAVLIATAAAKAHLRVDTADDDGLIDSYVAAATGRVEEHTLRQLVTATWRYTLDGWPYGNQIELPRPPLQSVTSIVYTKADNTTATVDAASFFVDTDSEPGRIVLKDGGVWPGDALRPAAAVAVTYVAGYGDPNDVPEGVITAVKLIVGGLYEHRESVVVGTIATPMPQSAEWLLSPYRHWHF